MVLTEERTVLLGNYLKDNADKAKALLALSVEDATVQINDDGFDFKIEEVQEFGDNLKKFASAEGELDEASLAEVSGGLAAAAAGVYLTCVSIGVTLGIAAGKNWKW